MGSGLAWAETGSTSSTADSSASDSTSSAGANTGSTGSSPGSTGSSPGSTSSDSVNRAETGDTSVTTSRDEDADKDADKDGLDNENADEDIRQDIDLDTESTGEVDIAPAVGEVEVAPEIEVDPTPESQDQSAEGIAPSPLAITEKPVTYSDRVVERSVPDPVESVAVTTSHFISRPSPVMAAATAPTADAGDPDVSARYVTTSVKQAAQPTRNLTMVAMAPLTTAIPQKPLLQRVVLNLLTSLGIGARASSIPGAPVWSPFVTALLGLATRREFTQPITALSTTANTTPVAALTLSDPAAAAVGATIYPGTKRTPVALSANTHFIEFVTGAGNLNNTISRFGIGGTDLGIMWDNGIKDDPTTAVDEHQVLIAFGDTFSSASPVRTGVWRFNTLFRSPDDVLTNGLYVPNGVPYNIFSGSPMERPNWSDPILPSPGQPVHPPYAIGPEVTIIPTAGISTPYENAYGARQYMSFMSIRSWDSAGRWTTNYAGVAFSDDNGQTWRIAPTSIRTAAVGRATVPFVSGNQNFQQGAFLKPPAGSPEAEQGWVYSYGTPSGRLGTVYLSRVQQDQILDTSKYEYWNGTSWTVNNPAAAKPVLPSKTTGWGIFKRTTYPSVSEMSVQYNPYLQKYVMLYGDSGNNMVMRTATSPEGTWSAPTTLVPAWRAPSLYAPYIHPWSGTENVPESEQHYLYWNMSTYNDYQVRFMRTDLTKITV